MDGLRITQSIVKALQFDNPLSLSLTDTIIYQGLDFSIQVEQNPQVSSIYLIISYHNPFSLNSATPNLFRTILVS